MDTLAIVLTGVGVVCAGVAAFLYFDAYDNYDHKLIAKFGGGVAVVATGIGTWMDSEQARKESYNCTVLNKHSDCPEGSFLGAIWNSYIEPATVEFFLVLAAGILGYVIAKATPRRPREARRLFDAPPFE